MTKRSAIDSILGSGRIAIAGVSRKDAKFGSTLFREMAESGKDVVGINPNMTSYMDRPCYRTIADLPDSVDALITVVKPEQTIKLVREAKEKGIRKIWMQQGSQSKEAVSFCESNGITCIAGECVFMYSEPVTSIHRFHRGINKLFGRYHKPAPAVM